MKFINKGPFRSGLLQAITPFVIIALVEVILFASVIYPTVEIINGIFINN
jgi:hypothetical protein